MQDTEHKVSATYVFTTYGYETQAKEAVERGRKELQLYFGRPVATTRSRVASIVSERAVQSSGGDGSRPSPDADRATEEAGAP